MFVFPAVSYHSCRLGLPSAINLAFPLPPPLPLLIEMLNWPIAQCAGGEGQPYFPLSLVGAAFIITYVFAMLIHHSRSLSLSLSFSLQLWKWKSKLPKWNAITVANAWKCTIIRNQHKECSDNKVKRIKQQTHKRQTQKQSNSLSLCLTLKRNSFAPSA